MVSSSTDSISAILVFSPEDIQLFLKWQGECGVDCLAGLIQNSHEYCEFIEHLRDNIATTNLERTISYAHNRNPAVKCGHELHPSDIVAAGYCPVCEVDMCLRFLNMLAKLFQKHGGPWPQEKIQKGYLELRQGWHMVRFQLAELVDTLECSKKYEEAWEKQHPEDVGCIWSTYSSTKAIRKAEMEHKYPALVSKTPTRPHAFKRKLQLSTLDAARAKIANTQKRLTKKHVTFTSDTKGEPGRRNACFHRMRGNEHYEPGNNAAPLGINWVDTSLLRSPIASLCNLKVYVVSLQAEFDALVSNSNLRPPSRYGGIVGLHPGIKAISNFVETYLQQSSDAREDMLDMISYADALIVFISDDGNAIKDMHFSQSDDVEDEDGLEEVVVDQARWTCRAECGVGMQPETVGDVVADLDIAENEEPRRKYRR
jgi:hypothetical protein